LTANFGQYFAPRTRIRSQIGSNGSG